MPRLLVCQLQAQRQAGVLQHSPFPLQAPAPAVLSSAASAHASPCHLSYPECLPYSTKHSVVRLPILIHIALAEPLSLATMCSHCALISSICSCFSLSPQLPGVLTPTVDIIALTPNTFGHSNAFWKHRQLSALSSRTP